MRDSTFLAAFFDPQKGVLDLSRTDVQDDDLAGVSQLADVKDVKLAHTRVTDRGLAILAEAAPGLELLDVSDTAAGDEGMRAVGSLRKLQVLHAGRTRLTDAGLAHLADLPDLFALFVEGTAVTDRGAEVLLGSANLRQVDITGTQITDAGLRRLITRQQIDLLHLGSDLISLAALNEANDRHPGAEILWAGGRYDLDDGTNRFVEVALG